MTDRAPTVLLVDDDPAIRRMLRRGLTRAGFDVTEAADGREAVEKLEQRAFDGVVTDVSMPGLDGFGVMEYAVANERARQVILVTGEGTIPLAIKAMREGAADFLTKPVDMDQLIDSMRRTIGGGPSSAEGETALERWRATHAPGMVGQDPQILEIFRIIERVAATDCNVLVTGPSGTGKELVARAIHAASGREDRPFVPVNCAAIPKDLMESEVFGHAKGAFTGATERREGKFQVADGGSLFLDEIGEMDVALQGKLLRVLQDKEVTAVGDARPKRVDVRVVAATNVDLEARSRSGQFREDLFYRLNVIPIHLPGLADRPGDIVPLAEHFIESASRRHQREVAGVDPSAAELLMGYPWPGNIRELENLIERLVILKHGTGAITADDLPANISGRQSNGRVAALQVPDDGLDIKATLEEMEIRLTQDALRRAGGNKARAAELLGLKRTTLIERLKRLNIRDAS